MQTRTIETDAADFDAMIAAYTRKGWIIVARGVRGVYLERNGEKRALFPR